MLVSYMIFRAASKDGNKGRGKVDSSYISFPVSNEMFGGPDDDGRKSISFPFLQSVL